MRMIFTTYVHRFLVTVASHPQEEECVACYTEEEKRTETSKQVRKYDKYKKIIELTVEGEKKMWTDIK